MPNDKFVDELKIQFDRYVELKERLDNKANNMITMAGTIAILFMGFGAFLLSDVDFKTNFGFPIIAAGALMVEVILTVITIKCALDSYKLREYEQPIVYTPFYDDNGQKQDVVDLFTNATEDELREHFTKEYLNCIKSYQQQNEEQTGGINTAQKTFVIAVAMIPIFAIFIILTKFLSV